MQGVAIWHLARKTAEIKGSQMEPRVILQLLSNSACHGSEGFVDVLLRNIRQVNKNWRQGRPAGRKETCQFFPPVQGHLFRPPQFRRARMGYVCSSD